LLTQCQLFGLWRTMVTVVSSVSARGSKSAAER
jgi:hypothetical protein